MFATTGQPGSRKIVALCFLERATRWNGGGVRVRLEGAELLRPRRKVQATENGGVRTSKRYQSGVDTWLLLISHSP